MKELFEYTLRLGDDSLILGHRLSEWCGKGPILEEDIAMTNFSLDLIGQATSFLKYAGEVEGKGRSEDDLAYLRVDRDYKNLLLVEQPNEDFAYTMVRQFFFDTFRLFLFEKLINSSDQQIKGIAEKSLKETKYHLKHSSEWIIRMGDGTEESHKRAQDAVDTLWRYTAEFFYTDDVDAKMVEMNVAPKIEGIEADWRTHVNAILDEATLTIPENKWKFGGGRKGQHSEHLGFILTELQYVQRAYPNMEW